MCPLICGRECPKAGLILALMGATKTSETDFINRNECHILIVGDPGLGKSQMLKACADVAPRGNNNIEVQISDLYLNINNQTIRLYLTSFQSFFALIFLTKYILFLFYRISVVLLHSLYYFYTHWNIIWTHCSH